VELRKLAADRLRRELSSEIDPKRRILLRSEMLCGYYERHIMPWSNRLVWAVCLITWFLACVAFCEAFGIVIYPAPGMGFVGYLTGWTVAWRLRDPRRALKEDLSL
jgi:hypothetical protein